MPTLIGGFTWAYIYFESNILSIIVNHRSAIIIHVHMSNDAFHGGRMRHRCVVKFTWTEKWAKTRTQRRIPLKRLRFFPLFFTRKMLLNLDWDLRLFVRSGTTSTASVDDENGKESECDAPKIYCRNCGKVIFQCAGPLIETNVEMHFESHPAAYTCLIVSLFALHYAHNRPYDCG